MEPETVRTDEEGFTLVELLVYSLLLVLVLAIVGGLFISTLRTESRIRSVTFASTQSQLIADSIGSGIRNASSFTVRQVGTDDQLLLARVATGDSALAWTCMAWYYDQSGNGSVRYKRSATEIRDLAQRDVDGWTLVGEGVQAVTGTTIFDQAGSTLKVEFTGTTEQSAPVAITSSTASRLGTTESAPCF